MENHYYTIIKKIFRQSDGLPIGLDMSVEAASIYMLLWDEEFLTKLKYLGISTALYKRYVDDILMILRCINRGWKYDKLQKKMIFLEDPSDQLIEDDAYTFGVLLDIANDLDSDIQMTCEVPSMHTDGRLPVLDLGLEIIDNKIKYFFYRKSVASPYSIMYESAVATRTKRDSLLQEGLRRLHHTCEDASEEDIRQVMGQYMNMLRISGYDTKYRYTLLNGIMKRYHQISDEISRGVRVKFRSRKQIQTHKKQKLGKFANTWFLKNNTYNTLKIQATPFSRLSNNVHQSLKKLGNLADGGNCKIIELGGKLITSGLTKFQNFGGQGSCFMGRECNMDSETDCRINRSVYQSECQLCVTDQKSVYVGTTGRVTHSRQKERQQQITGCWLCLQFYEVEIKWTMKW